MLVCLTLIELLTAIEALTESPIAFCSWQPSVTTDEIDRAVHQMIIDAGAYPSPLGYGGFPKSVCTSVNECNCHGIPDSRALQVRIGTLPRVTSSSSFLLKMFPCFY